MGRGKPLRDRPAGQRTRRSAVSERVWRLEAIGSTLRSMTSRSRGMMTPLPFVGRVEEVRELAGRLGRLRSGTGGVVLIGGEPGIGKTRLIERVVAPHAGQVAWATCGAGDGVPPFWPWRRVLRQVMAQASVEHAARSWPDLRLLTEDVADAPLPEGASRYRLFEGVTATLAAAGRRDGVAVVLDDLQWVDEGSIRLLEFVARESQRLPVLVLCAYRDTELAQGHPLLAALPDLVRFGSQLTLEGLSAADLGALYRSFKGVETAPEELGSTLYRQTGGNPFFVGEVLRLLPSGTGLAGLSPQASARGGVRAVVDQRLARLPRATQDLLTWAAVDGGTLDVDLLAVVTGQRRQDVLTALDPAVSARLLKAGDGGRLMFAHDLLREAVVASIAINERVERHWALGMARSQNAGCDVERISSVAGHLTAGVAAGDADEAVTWAVRAAELASAVLAYENAVSWYQRAVTILRDTGGRDRTESTLLLAWGGAQLDAGRLSAARDVFLDAARLAREGNDAEGLAAAALGLGAGLGGFEVSLFDHIQIDLLEEALAALPDHDSRVRAWVLARLSVALAFVEGPDRRRRLSEDALAMGRRLGDEEACAYSLAAWCDAVSGPDDVDQRLEAASEAVRLASATGLRPLELLGRRLRLVALLERGEVAAAASEVEAFSRSADLLRQPLYRWYVPLWRAALAMASGDLERAAGLTDEAERLGASACSPNARTLVAVQRFVRLRCEGRFTEAGAIASELLADVPDIAAPDAMEGSRLLRDVVNGRADMARRRADAMVAAGLRATRCDSEWLSDMAQLADAAVALQHERLADVVFEALEPYVKLFVVEGIGAALCAPVAHYLAETARLTGRSDEADRYAHLALQLCSVAGVLLDPPPLALRSGSVAHPHQDETAEFRREGDLWAISYAGTTVRVRASKGLHDIAVLLRSPGRAVHVTELTGAPVGSTGESLDETALAAYRRRLQGLEEEIETAEADSDVGRRSDLVTERDFLVNELTSALGLGGRRRRPGDPVERSRKAVAGRIGASIDRIAAVHSTLGRHLANSIRTGTWCCYQPEQLVSWRIR